MYHILIKEVKTGTHDSNTDRGYGSDLRYSDANMTLRMMAGIKSSKHQAMLAQKPFCVTQTDVSRITESCHLNYKSKYGKCLTK